MSEESQITWFVILALIGAGTAVVYIFKLLFWVLLYALTHPVNALVVMAAGGVAYYVGGKLVKQ